MNYEGILQFRGKWRNYQALHSAMTRFCGTMDESEEAESGSGENE